MKPKSLPEMFYRAKQTAIAGTILAGKMTDLIYAFSHLCEANGVEVPEGMTKQMAEIESMLKRIEDINSLPLSDLFRLPRLRISDESKHQDDFDSFRQGGNSTCFLTPDNSSRGTMTAVLRRPWSP